MPATVVLGLVLTAEGRTEDAAEVLSDVAADSDAEVARRLALCKVYLQAGDHSRAIRHAQRAVSMSKTPTSYALLSRAFLASDQLSKAEAAAQGAMEENPYSARAHLALARVQVASNEKEKALKTCEKALELDPFLVDAMALQGELHLELGEPREAASAWQEALELNQWNQSLRWKLAELLRTKLDSPREATRQYRRCAEMGGPRAEKAAEWVDELKTTHKGKDSPEPTGGEQAP